jgi:hypothetical protein
MDKNQKKVQNKSCGCLITDMDYLNSCSEDDQNFMSNPDVEDVSLNFYNRHLTDGLPIIPPTRERVDKFIEETDLSADEVIAILPPRMGKATVEKIAINAVMAGCLPQFMPVLLQAIKALSSEKFNLVGLNATTHPVAIATIVNGPLVRELGFNSGVGCLGPGNLTNATIGRSIRLCMFNLAGAVPGVADHATMGSPAKYGYCFAEAEDESPWKPLHEERGFKSEKSTLTMIGVEAPHNVNDHRSIKAENLLETIAHTATTAGCNNSHVPGEILIIMSPEHARTISKEGWDKLDVKNYLHENMTIPRYLGDRGGRKLDEKWIKNYKINITKSPSDVILVVAGGPGRHTMISHGFGTSSQSVTDVIKF